MSSELEKSLEPQTVVQTIGQAPDLNYLGILSEELEVLESHFEETNTVAKLLIELYQLDPSTQEDRFIEIVIELGNLKKDISLDTSKLFQLQTQFEQLYLNKIKALQKVTEETHEKYSRSFEILYEQNSKNEEFKELEKTKAPINPIDLDEKVLDLSLSKDETLNILLSEKKKRAKLAFENEQILTPHIKELSRKYEKWGITDNELKRFLQNDMEQMNKKVQHVKKTENI